MPQSASMMPMLIWKNKRKLPPTKHNDADTTLKKCHNDIVVFLVVLVTNFWRRIYDVVWRHVCN